VLSQNAMLKFSLVLPTLALLGACQGVAPEGLRRASVEKSLTVQHPVNWKAGFWNLMLAADTTYVGKFEDNTGTYYLGPSPCLYVSGKVRDEPLAGSAWDCGIFVPHTAGRAPKVFVVNDTSRAQTDFNTDGTPDISKINPIKAVVPGPTTGIVLTALLEMDKGRFRDFTWQPANGWFESAVKAKP
jgi:hypothetical protein